MDFGEICNISKPVRLVRPEGGLYRKRRQAVPAHPSQPPPALRHQGVCRYSCNALIRGQLQLPSPRGGSLYIALRGCSKCDTASGTSWHGYGLFVRHQAPGPLLASWPTPCIRQKHAQQNWRAIAASIPHQRHQTYRSPNMLALLRFWRLIAFTPLSITGSRDAGGREKMAI